MPGENLLEKVKKFDTDTNEIDLKEFSDGVKNLTETEYKELGNELTKKDSDFFKLLATALDKAQESFDAGTLKNEKIIRLLVSAGKIENKEVIKKTMYEYKDGKWYSDGKEIKIDETSFEENTTIVDEFEKKQKERVDKIRTLSSSCKLLNIRFDKYIQDSNVRPQYGRYDGLSGEQKEKAKSKDQEREFTQTALASKQAAAAQEMLSYIEANSTSMLSMTDEEFKILYTEKLDKVINKDVLQKLAESSADIFNIGSYEKLYSALQYDTFDKGTVYKQLHTLRNFSEIASTQQSDMIAESLQDDILENKNMKEICTIKLEYRDEFSKTAVYDVESKMYVQYNKKNDQFILRDQTGKEYISKNNVIYDKTTKLPISGGKGDFGQNMSLQKFPDKKNLDTIKKNWQEKKDVIDTIDLPLAKLMFDTIQELKTDMIEEIKTGKNTITEQLSRGNQGDLMNYFYAKIGLYLAQQGVNMFGFRFTGELIGNNESLPSQENSTDIEFGPFKANEEMIHFFHKFDTYTKELFDDISKADEQIESENNIEEIRKSVGGTLLLQNAPNMSKDANRLEDAAEAYMKNGNSFADAQGNPIEEIHDLTSNVQQALIKSQPSYTQIVSLIDKSKIESKNVAFSKLCTRKLIEGTMEGFSDKIYGTDMLTGIKDRDTIIDTYANIEGIGPYTSDKTVANIANWTKEIVIQIAMIYVSGGLANVATKGIMLGGSRLLASTAIKSGISWGEKIALYYKEAQLLTAGSKLAIGTADLTLEGGLFHAFNTLLGGVVNGQSGKDISKELTNVRGYARSIAYIGVMRMFGTVNKLGTDRATKSFSTLIKEGKITEKSVGTIMKTISIPMEVGTMAGTDLVMNFSESVLMGEDMRPIDLTNIIAIVVGLRMAHAGGSPFKQGEEIIIKKMKISDGKIAELQFETQNKITKEVSVQKENEAGKNPEIVKVNALLSPEARIIEAKKLLGLDKITPEQEQAILDAHNKSGEIYNLDFAQIRARFDILQKAGFTSEQIRILMENGICGKILIPKELIENREKILDNLKKIILHIKEFNDMINKPSNIHKIMEVLENNKKMLMKQLEVFNAKIKQLEQENDILPEIKQKQENIYKKIQNKELDNLNDQEIKQAYAEYFDVSQKLGYIYIDHVGETFTIPKIRGVYEGKKNGYNEDAVYLDKDIAIISDGVSDSPYSYKSHGLIRYLAENKLKIHNENDIANLVINFGKEQNDLINGGVIGSLCIVINNKNGSKTGFVLGDSSLFIDGVEYKNEQANISVNTSNGVSIPKGITYNNKGNLLFVDEKVFVMVPKMKKIDISPDSQVILTTDLVADYVRGTKFLQSTKSIPALLKMKSLKEGPNDDISYIVLEKHNTVQANAELSPEARIAKAKELVGTITPAQEQAILDAHNKPGEIYNLDFTQIKERVDILQKAKFTSKDIRVLMENGICGRSEPIQITPESFCTSNNIKGEQVKIIEKLYAKLLGKSDLLYEGEKILNILKNIDEKTLKDLLDNLKDGCLSNRDLEYISQPSIYGKYEIFYQQRQISTAEHYNGTDGEIIGNKRGEDIRINTDTKKNVIIFNEDASLTLGSNDGKKEINQSKKLVLTKSIVGSETIKNGHMWRDREFESRKGLIDKLTNSIQNYEGFDYAFDGNDAVVLIEFKGFNGEPLYIVHENGNHRVAAAKYAGLSHIVANVKNINDVSYFTTTNAGLAKQRENRIQNGYISGEVVYENGMYYLNYKSGIFDGCHISDKEIKKYVEIYEANYSKIPSELKQKIDSMLDNKSLITKLPENFKELSGENSKLISEQKNFTEREIKSKINPEIVKANALLGPEARILEAKKLLGLDKITPEQEQAILEAHNKPGEIYNLDFAQIKERVEILQKAKFTSKDIRVLMENGICGEVKTDLLEATSKSSSEQKNLTDLESSFKLDYEKGLTKEEVFASRNLGIYKYQDKIIKVVKNKRNIDVNQIQLMNERLSDFDNVFHPIDSFALKEGVSCIVMEVAPGKDASTLTAQEIEVVPTAHWQKFEKDVRELSNRGVQIDLTKRSNFFYDKNKGFQFLDIEGISMDGTGTDKFFLKDGKEYYYPFEQKRVMPKEYISAKDMFLRGKEGEGNFSQENFITEKGENLLTTIKSLEVKKEMLNIMQKSIDSGMLDLKNGKAYVEVNGQKVESNLFNETMKHFGKEQAMFTWLQVRTQNFKNWFGDWQGADKTNVSKVVDKNGEPLMVWHGTSREFDAFKKGVHKNFGWVENTKNWFYFSTNVEFTKTEYAEMKQRHLGSILTSEEFNEIFRKEGGETRYDYERQRNDMIESIGTDKMSFDENGSMKYKGIQFHDNEARLSVGDGKIPTKDDFIMGEYILECSIDGELQKIPLSIYIPKKNFKPINIPFFVKSSDMVKKEGKMNGNSSRLDNNFDAAIKESNPNTDVILVINEETGTVSVGVKNATQIKSATENDGFFNEVSPKFKGDKKSKINPEIVKANALLSPEARILEAKKLLGLDKITPEQEQAILEAHNKPGEIYNLDFAQIKERVNILQKAKFTSKEIRVLMENGICGNESKYKETVDGIIKMHGESEIIENCIGCTVNIGGRKLEILKVGENPDIPTFNTPYIIIDRALYTSSGGKKGYKGLSADEEVILGRKNQNEKFDFESDNTISGTHVKISYKDGKIIVEDLYSTNGTKISSINTIVTLDSEVVVDNFDKSPKEELERINGKIKELESSIESWRNELPNYQRAALKSNASEKIKEVYEKRKADLEIIQEEMKVLQKEKMELLKNTKEEIIELTPEMIVKESLPEAYFENFKSFDELYETLLSSKDKIGDYTPIELFEAIENIRGGKIDKIKGLTLIPKEGGLRIKVEKLLQMENILKFSDGPKKLFETTDPEIGRNKVEQILSELTNRGKIYDNMQNNSLLTENMVKYHGTYSGRPIVEVKMPNGNSEFFYKSTGWAGKDGKGLDGTTNGMWQVFGGFAKANINGKVINNWFIKNANYENYYGSKTFESIAKSLDNVLIKKNGLHDINQLNSVINFQNQVYEKDTYQPI